VEQKGNTLPNRLCFGHRQQSPATFGDLRVSMCLAAPQRDNRESAEGHEVLSGFLAQNIRLAAELRYQPFRPDDRVRC
jgi:hypothetical protein